MFSSRLTVLACFAATLLLVACSSSDDGGGPGPCETDPIPAECNQPCSDTDACPAGFFCDTDNTCSAECTPSGNQCSDSEECNGNGQCVGGGDDGADDGAECPAVEVNLTPVVPVVTLLIDQSASMNDAFGDTSRWEALKDALIGDGNDGLLFELQTSLNMGVSLYTSRNGGTVPDDCPLLTSVEHSVNNAQSIASFLEANDPIDDTPTAEAVDAAAASFPASDNPRVIVLATDGLPDRCADPDAHDDISRANVETAVQDAFGAGLQTFVLSIGPELNEVQDHLQRVANAGQGLDLDTGDAPFYTALDPDALADAFETIIGGIRSCEIDVDGEVDLDRADEGTVVLNGDELEFGIEWQMQDEDTIILLGDACTTFLGADTVSLSAEFPCGSVVVVD